MKVAQSAITVSPMFSFNVDRRIISAIDMHGRVTSTPCGNGAAGVPSNPDAADVTPLILAAQQGRLDIVRSLIAAHAALGAKM